MNLKESIHQQFVYNLRLQIETLMQSLNDLHTSAGNETKRTAGDKHETALAMLQIEQEMKRNQLNELNNKKTALQNINPQIAHTQIQKGSLIKTNIGLLYMCVALPQIIINDTKVIAISPQSPLGNQLFFKEKGDFVKINDSIIEILNIY